jgi:hypothetical protein
MGRQSDPSKVASIESDADYERARHVGSAPCPVAKVRPPLGDMLYTESRGRTNEYHCDGKTNTEAQDQRSAQSELFELEAEQQYSYRGGTWYKPPVNPNMII